MAVPAERRSKLGTVGPGPQRDQWFPPFCEAGGGTQGSCFRQEGSRQSFAGFGPRGRPLVYLVVFFPALDTASIRTGHFSYSLASPATVPRSSLHSPPSKNHLVLPMATITLHLGHGTCIRPICTRFGLFPVKLGVNLGFMVNDGVSAALPKQFGNRGVTSFSRC
jgi:hypothetical protein